MAAPTSQPHDRRPVVVTALGGLQFLVAAAVVIVLLGDGELDGELGPGDIARAVGAAILGAVVVGATWAGGKFGWWLQLVLALVALAWGGVTLAMDDPPGAPAIVIGVLWVGLALLPPCRNWYLGRSGQ